MRGTAVYQRVIMLLFAIFMAKIVRAHCQIPCGIYDDRTRVILMTEHVMTIEKSMKQIELIKSQNQTVRWILNKETHAKKLTEIVTSYFLSQRIKPGMARYEENLKILHEIILQAMKSKQTTDLAHVKKLKELLHAFEQAYFGRKHKH